MDVDSTAGGGSGVGEGGADAGAKRRLDGSGAGGGSGEAGAGVGGGDGVAEDVSTRAVMNALKVSCVIGYATFFFCQSRPNRRLTGNVTGGTGTSAL